LINKCFSNANHFDKCTANRRKENFGKQACFA